MMIRDSLTGLLNHTTIRERLMTELLRSARQNTPLTYAILDIDNFKTVNDTYGHATGDRVLKSLSQMLIKRLRQSDIIGRYGGEEFAIILPNTSAPMGEKIMDELRFGFSQLLHHSGEHEFSVTFSCGLATFPAYESISLLSEAADKALYEAKHQGRNQTVVSSGA
jgi:diguanylate cyclase (GGDEF)-like protein